MEAVNLLSSNKYTEKQIVSPSLAILWHKCSSYFAYHHFYRLLSTLITPWAKCVLGLSVHFRANWAELGSDEADRTSNPQRPNFSQSHSRQPCTPMHLEHWKSRHGRSVLNWLAETTRLRVGDAVSNLVFPMFCSISSEPLGSFFFWKRKYRTLYNRLSLLIGDSIQWV